MFGGQIFMTKFFKGIRGTEYGNYFNVFFLGEDGPIYFTFQTGKANVKKLQERIKFRQLNVYITSKTICYFFLSIVFMPLTLNK